MNYLLSPHEHRAVIDELVNIAKNVKAGTASRNESDAMIACCRKLEAHNVALTDLLMDKHTV